MLIFEKDFSTKIHPHWSTYNVVIRISILKIQNNLEAIFDFSCHNTKYMYNNIRGSQQIMVKSYQYRFAWRSFLASEQKFFLVSFSDLLRKKSTFLIFLTAAS